MSAAGQPWMKFYPTDWRADPMLRVCSIAARGLWMEMLCLMHEAEPRGSLSVAGKPVSEAQLAALVGISRKLAASLISELEQAGVFSRDGETIFSRRMRRDVAKAERDKANGKTGGNPNLKRGVNPQDKGGDKAQKPEARDQKETSSLRSDVRSPAAPTDRALEPAAKRSRPTPKPRKHPFPEDAFARWYARYPRKKARQDAEKAFRKIETADDTPFETLLGGIEAFAGDNPDVGFWPYPASWLNGQRWLDEPASSAATTASVTPGGEPRVSFGGGVAWPESMVRRQVDKWRVDPGSWPEHALGPPPNAPGCRVPNELLRMAA